MQLIPSHTFLRRPLPLASAALHLSGFPPGLSFLLSFLVGPIFLWPSSNCGVLRALSLAPVSSHLAFTLTFSCLPFNDPHLSHSQAQSSFLNPHILLPLGISI